MNIFRPAMAFLAMVACTLTISGCSSDSDDKSAANANGRPPTISGVPQSAVSRGESYSFTPTVSDPDGDSLNFSVDNLPRWAAFDSSTGRISGQPALADVGVYSNIVISVSDGANSVSLSGFDITVLQLANGSMLVSWTPPTENTDGSALLDLSGYRIYFGTSPGDYPNKVDVETPGVSVYLIEDLMPATYYVVATAVSASGIESNYSNMAVKIVEGG